MGPSTMSLSLLSLFLITALNAQTGKLCLLKTCSQPGQVRIDAVVDPLTNEFVRGCNCACPPSMYDGTSPDFCDPTTHEINYDENTLLGDCSCSCLPSSPDPTSCIKPSVWNPKTCSCGCPPSAPDPSSCIAPSIFRRASCLCGCEQGDIGGPCIVNGAAVAGTVVTSDCTCDVSQVQCPGNQKANPVSTICECPPSQSGSFLPNCEPPTVRDPITCDCITTTTTTRAPTRITGGILPQTAPDRFLECGVTPGWVPNPNANPPLERDNKSCAFDTITITNPTNNYYVICSASGSCYDSTINIDLISLDIDRLRGISCSMVAACMNTKFNVNLPINISNPNGHRIRIMEIICDTRYSCKNTAFTFGPDIYIEPGDVYCGWDSCDGCTINGVPCLEYA